MIGYIPGTAPFSGIAVTLPGKASGGPSEPLEHIPQVLKLFLEHPADDDNIILVHLAGFVRQAPKEGFHELFERCRSISEAKQHNYELPVSLLSFIVAGMEGYLSVAALQVQGRVPLSSDKRVQGVVDRRQR